MCSEVAQTFKKTFSELSDLQEEFYMAVEFQLFGNKKTSV